MRRNPIVRGRLRRPVTPKDAMTIGRRIGESRKWTRDPERFEEFRMGLTEELEHRDVTHGRALTTGRIARAHLKEDPRYYSKLKDMMAQGRGPSTAHKGEVTEAVQARRRHERLLREEAMENPSPIMDEQQFLRGSLKELMRTHRWAYYINFNQDPSKYDGYIPSIVFEDVSGYWPVAPVKGMSTSWGSTLEQAEKVALMENAKLGLSESDASDIVMSSMFPRADRGERKRPVRRNPLGKSIVGNIVYLRGEKHVEPYKVLEDNGDRILVRGFVPGWDIQPTRTVRKDEIVNIFRKNPRLRTPLRSAGLIGYYNELGYRICKMSDGRIVDEVYSAGNSPVDSQQTVPVQHGVGLKKIKEWAEQTGREMAGEARLPFFGIEYEEPDR